MFKPGWHLNKDRVTAAMHHALRKVRQWLRALSGDDAYERYLAHWQLHNHAHETRPLDRKAFYQMEQQRKWSGISRCC